MDKPVEHLPWPAEEIRSQLQRILEHPEFHATDKMRDFLRFVVEETLAGNTEHLKGFTIAMEVFGRDQDFDPAHDPVVRIQAGRLRRAIERYYLVAGTHDPVRIDIPKGGYVPVFSAGPGADDEAAGEDSARLWPPGASWPSVLVMPFDDLTVGEELAYLGPGLATELCLELGQCTDLRVMLSRDQVAGAAAHASSPDFVVRGSIRGQDSEVKVAVQLVAAGTGEQLWADSLKTSIEDARLIAFQENTASAIAAHLSGSHGAIFRALSGGAVDRPDAELSSYQAILKGYAYQQKVDAASYMGAFEALREAHRRDAECGLVCTMLAILYLDNLAMEFMEVRQTPAEEALRLAHEGVRIEPGNQLSHLVLARSHLLDDDLAAGLAEVEAALALKPDSLLFMDAAGYLTTLLGDWDRGEALIRRAIALNPHYRVFARYATWLNAFRRGAYDQALEETQWLAGVAYFWDPLCRAATLGQLGRVAESRQAVGELLELKPDFPQRGSDLIGHYIKFPDIRERILQGLAAGGLRLETAAD
ncbi:MAG: hypothetical protein P8080_04535 [Gammaproteobacteria bacterium]